MKMLETEGKSMGFKLDLNKANNILQQLQKEYKIYAPKRFEKAGRYSDTDIVKYVEINSVEEIEFNEKSDYPAKEVVTPITQTLFFFTEDEFRESKIHDKKVLIFARPCDINAQKVQDRIFLDNGFEDSFYKRMREKVSFVMMECAQSWDTCFCTAMGSNKADEYAMSVRCEGDSLLLNVKDENFNQYFEGAEEAEFEFKFIQENQAQITVPEIEGKELLNKVKGHEMWNEYDGRCVACGSCTISCSTCACFTTTDVMYSENKNVGERRRTSASCHVEGFDEMAGGHDFRPSIGQRMRYKVLHKFHDYNDRFNEGHMCVGCGRCTSKCPQHISMTTTVNKLNDAIEQIKEENSAVENA